MIIANSLGSNYSGGDVRLALSLLLRPWRWRKGKETEKLKRTLFVKFRKLPDGSLRNFHVQLFCKGRQAIKEALKILKIGLGNEVILQAFTCVAVVEPILETGATPIYVDVAYRRLNPLLSSIKAMVTPKTKAVILQHTLGYVNPENEEIIKWCGKNKIAVIQDLAHAFSAPGLEKVRPSKVGPWEAIILSFSQDKVIDGISGGALISSNPKSKTNKKSDDSNHQTNGETAKSLLYPLITYVIRATYSLKIGKLVHFTAKKLGLMNSPIYAPKETALPNAFAALALNQFRRLDKISNHRRKIALLYNEALGSKFKIVSKDEISAGANLRYPIWVYPAKGGVNNRNKLESKLQKHNFYLVDHWYDSPISPKWIDFNQVNYSKGSCPNAEELAKHIFNLPTHANIGLKKARELAVLIDDYAK